MLYREIIAVCSQMHTKHINTAVWTERGLPMPPQTRRGHSSSSTTLCVRWRSELTLKLLQYAAGLIQQRTIVSHQQAAVMTSGSRNFFSLSFPTKL